MNHDKTIQVMLDRLSDYISEYNLKSMVLGISGGADSALAAILCSQLTQELNIPLIGRSLPCFSKEEEQERASRIGSFFCSDFNTIDIHNEYVLLKNALSNNERPMQKIQDGNLKARIRMCYLYNLASVNNGLVISTDNLTEYLLGFWTLHGDVGDYGPFQNLYKSEVYDLLKYFENSMIQDDIIISGLHDVISANPTDGNGVSNTDFDQFDIPKEIFIKLNNDPHALYDWVETPFKTNIPIEQQKPWSKIIQLNKKTSYKRTNPYNIPRNILI